MQKIKRICITHAKIKKKICIAVAKNKENLLTMQKLKRICSPNAKNENKLHSLKVEIIFKLGEDWVKISI